MLIGLTGARGSGKDSFAQVFIEAGFVNLKMAGPLKEMLTTLYRCGGYGDNIIAQKLEGSLKNEPCDLLLGQTPRWAMQSLGTEWRNMIHPHLWVSIWRSKAQNLLLQGTPIICTDVRFHIEADAMRPMGARLYRIERPGHEIDDQHVSEREMKEIQVDETIYNTTTIQALQRKAELLLKEVQAC